MATSTSCTWATWTACRGPRHCSTRLLKGEKRPIVPQEERAQLLVALECVDYVVIFEERTAERLLAALQPDIYAKGGDWAMEDLPEAKVAAEHGIRIEILPRLPNHSTTDIIGTILARYGGTNGG